MYPYVQNSEPKESLYSVRLFGPGHWITSYFCFVDVFSLLKSAYLLHWFTPSAKYDELATTNIFFLADSEFANRFFSATKHRALQ